MLLTYVPDLTSFQTLGITCLADQFPVNTPEQKGAAVHILQTPATIFWKRRSIYIEVISDFGDN